MKTTKEIWRDVPDYEGLYQVSNLGIVKSLERVIYRSNGHPQTFKERILKAATSISGYLVVALSKYGKLKTFKVHQLVAMAFLNHIPCGNKMVVDHIDNDKLNNRADNLQITTHRHNSTKDIKGGTSKYIGVCWHKKAKKWSSSIRINGKQNHLGIFKNELEASNAYQNALKELGGYNG